jgi:hypothetical protein
MDQVLFDVATKKFCRKRLLVINCLYFIINENFRSSHEFIIKFVIRVISHLEVVPSFYITFETLGKTRKDCSNTNDNRILDDFLRDLKKILSF